MSVPKAKIVSRLELTDSKPAYHIIKFPKALLAEFNFKRNLRRVICSINGDAPYHCAVFPAKSNYMITVNKETRDRLGLAVGDEVRLEFVRDESEFGMPMPEELAEVLRQDDEGERLFRALSPGNQRIMMKLIEYSKDEEKRIIRSLTGVELLKKNDGKFDYHLQNNGMRVACSMGMKFER
ncbi:MAG TPA: YdeI/OmpD-associated family protein [Pyrinomonadaceae bacterium]|nr:YdeI/OmpD-associated family protein [Pyrinomonadaceae bacterium]